MRHRCLLLAFFCLIAHNLYAQRPSLTLAVCDQVALSPKVLRTAHRNTLDVFGSAGIDVRWINLDPNSKCAVPAGATNCFVIVILPKAPKDAASPEAMGHAPNRTGWIPRAYVFYNWVQMMVNIVEGRRASEEALGILLGHVMAHELGHLLSPAQSHSLTGIMSTEWRYGHWEDAVAGRLRFNDSEAKGIRAKIMSGARVAQGQ